MPSICYPIVQSLSKRRAVVKLLMILCALCNQLFSAKKERILYLYLRPGVGWAVNFYSRIHFQYTHFSPPRPICKVSHFSNLVGTYPRFHNANVYHEKIHFFAIELRVYVELKRPSWQQRVSPHSGEMYSFLFTQSTTSSF